MAHDAYEWSGSILCEEDVVDVLTDHDPWIQWLDHGLHGESTAEIELDSIATLFNIDRSNEDALRRRGFPVRLQPAPETFCSACLSWFN